MALGSIVAVEGLDKYVVAASGEERAAVGSFVKVMSSPEVVGIIVGYVNTIKEELIPYMQPQMRERYLPYNIEPERTHYTVLGVGTQSSRHVSVPPHIGNEVHVLPPEEMKSFYMNHGVYYLTQKRDVIGKDVALLIVERLAAAIPEDKRRLEIIRKHIETW